MRKANTISSTEEMCTEGCKWTRQHFPTADYMEGAMVYVCVLKLQKLRADVFCDDQASQNRIILFCVTNRTLIVKAEYQFLTRIFVYACTRFSGHPCRSPCLSFTATRGGFSAFLLVTTLLAAQIP